MDSPPGGRIAQTFTAIQSGTLVRAELEFIKPTGTLGDFILRLASADTFGIPANGVGLEFPQGGERLVGLASVRAMREAYPAPVSLTIGRIRGSGALWVAENLITYDGATSMHATTIMEFQDGMVVRETIYFGEPWTPPAWRAPWVEPMPGL